MPFSSGLEAGGYAGRVQMSPRGPRSLSVPTDLEAQRQFRSTMDKLGQGAPFATRKVSDETTSAFPLLKPPTGTPGAERKEFNLAGFPPKVEKDAEGNELPPDPEAPPPELPDVLLRKFATRGDAPNLKLLLEFCAKEKNVEEIEDEVTKVKTEVVTYNAAEGIDFKEGNRGEGCPGFKEGDPKKDFKGRGIDVRNTHNGFTAFHWCCQNGTDKGITAAQTAQTALDADNSKEGRSKANPYPDYIACMKLLIDWGANPTLLDFMGRTGRDLAALKGNFQMVEAVDAYLAEHPWKDDE